MIVTEVEDAPSQAALTSIMVIAITGFEAIASIMDFEAIASTMDLATITATDM
jgi:hypothetical protein